MTVLISVNVKTFWPLTAPLMLLPLMVMIRAGAAGEPYWCGLAGIECDVDQKVSGPGSDGRSVVWAALRSLCPPPGVGVGSTADVRRR